jgi:hypothetical protein
LSKPATLRASAQELLAEEAKFTSQHFRITSHASVREDAPGVQLWATVRRTGEDVQLIFLMQR